jgi:hypothetical protein
MALLTNDSAFLEPLDYTNRSPAEKAYIDALIPVGQKYLEDYCKRLFEVTTYTDEVLNGTGGPMIFVKNPPIISLTELKIIWSFATTDTGTDTINTYDDAELLWDAASGKVQFKPRGGSSRPSSFPDGFQNVKITYSGGYASTSADFSTLSYLNAQFVIETFDPSEKVGVIDREKLGDYFYARTKGYAEQFIANNKRILGLYRLRELMV